MELSKIDKKNNLFKDGTALISSCFKFKYIQLIYWTIVASAVTGTVFAILQSLGFTVGGTGVTVSNNKIRLIVMLFNYVFVHLVVLFILMARTITEKINKYWVLILIYVSCHSILFLVIQKSVGELFSLYLKLVGVLLLIFLHSINVSDQYVRKLIKLSLNIFKLTLFFAAIQEVMMLMGYSITIHSGRIDSIFSDYNGLSSFLLSMIPLLWLLNKKKSVFAALTIIILTNSASCLAVLIIFIMILGIKKIKKKKYFKRTVIFFIVTVIAFFSFLNLVTVEQLHHPDSAILKIRQLFHVLSFEKIVIIKDNLNILSYETTKDLIGIEYSTGVKRMVQFVYATMGWNSITELVFGLRRGWAEGFLLTILINFGLVGFFIFIMIYRKYYILKTYSKTWRAYYLSLLFGAGFALPILSFPISMFMVSVNIYITQRLIIMKHNQNIKSLD